MGKSGIVQKDKDMKPKDEAPHPGRKVSHMLLGKRGGQLLWPRRNQSGWDKAEMTLTVDRPSGESEGQYKQQCCMGTRNVRAQTRKTGCSQAGNGKDEHRPLRNQ